MNNRFLIIAIAFGWHFFFLPVALLWSLHLMGFYEAGLTKEAFLGAVFVLCILRSAISPTPYPGA